MTWAKALIPLGIVGVIGYLAYLYLSGEQKIQEAKAKEIAGAGGIGRGQPSIFYIAPYGKEAMPTPEPAPSPFVPTPTPMTSKQYYTGTREVSGVTYEVKGETPPPGYTYLGATKVGQPVYTGPYLEKGEVLITESVRPIEPERGKATEPVHEPAPIPPPSGGGVSTPEEWYTG